jgi:ABC-type nitrate/sulfonate/bicarbonate transport system ATPase subunit
VSAVPHSGATLPATERPRLTIRGPCKSFGGSPFHQDFDLDLPRQAVTSLFGPNGCGRSTLIDPVAGLLPIDRGEVRFDGKTLRAEVGRRVGLLDSATTLFIRDRLRPVLVESGTAMVLVPRDLEEAVWLAAHALRVFQREVRKGEGAP